MTDTAFVAMCTAVPLVVGQIANLIISMRNGRKADVLTAKSDVLDGKADKIQTQTDGNTTKLSAQLDVAHEKLDAANEKIDDLRTGAIKAKPKSLK